MGAVPLWRAKCPAVGKRRMSPARPMMIVAVSGPIPWTLVIVEPVVLITVAVRVWTSLGRCRSRGSRRAARSQPPPFRW